MATTNKRPKNPTFTTEPGTSRYPKLNTPDTKYKAEGEYSVKMVFDAKAIQPLVDQYEAEVQKVRATEKARLMEGDGKSKAKAKSLSIAESPFKADVDDEGEETGKTVVNFKLPAKIIPKDPAKKTLVLKPDIFDAQGRMLADPPEIWGGSILRISGELRPYYNAKDNACGLSMRLRAAQIIELRQGGQRDAAGYGFGAVEGGYSASQSSAADDSDEGDEGSSQDGGDTAPNGDF